MTATTVLIAACAVTLGGAAGIIPCCRDRRLAGQVNLASTVLAGLLAGGAALAVLAGGASRPVTVWSLPEYASAIRVQLDGLSALFVLLIALVSVAAACYSQGYLEHYPDYGLLRYYPAFQLFVGGMYAIVTITDLMVGFLLCWQVMTFASYALIRFEHRKAETVRAANRYLLAMQAAVLLILLGAGLLAHGPVSLPGGETLMRYDFDAIRHGMPALLRNGGSLATVGLLCFLLGFGIKAGMWPFGQWWLPVAHPAAPSPVSALLSGVMIKTGVYGLMRSFLWLIPAEAALDYRSDVWGLVIGALGTATLFLGTCQALGEDQTKRLLAYSSIGQAGYILLALGTAVALLPRTGPDAALLGLAMVALSAALFHTLNHGLYKSLLFLSAGSLLVATDTQDLNRMGGLARHMPWTAAAALIGSLAISGVPLLNGFASKWSIFIATMLGARHMPYLTVCAVVAMFTSVLTLALFLKFFGASFLGRVSRRVAECAAAGRVREEGWLMRGPQLALAGGCILLGLAPSLGYRLAYRTIQGSAQGLAASLATVPPFPIAGGTGVAGPADLGVLAPLPLALAFALLLLLAVLLSRAGGALRRRAEPWLCGYAVESDQMRYGARHFYREALRLLPWVRRPTASPPGNGHPAPPGRLPHAAGSASPGTRPTP